MKPGRPVRVLLADDHPIWTEGLAAMLASAGYEVTAKAADGLQAVELARRRQPDVAILDIAMPRLNGVEAAAEINRLAPDTKCILLTVHADERYVLRALRRGVKGYLTKTQSFAEVEQAIRRVINDEVYLGSGVSDCVVRAYLKQTGFDNELLTARERQILQLVAEGYSTKEIASLLTISVKTVESHRARLMRKLNIHNVADLVRYAVRRGIVHL